jgi:DNA-binding transcriptional MerR regulator
MKASALPIGEVSRLSGVKAPTIRYYEQIGLVVAPPRSDGNRRTYCTDDVRRLAFIRHARELGFELEAIRQLLKLQDQPANSCAEADGIARTRLEEVEWRLNSLHALKSELERMLAGCRSGHIADCKVIEALADHSKCRNAHH